MTECDEVAESMQHLFRDCVTMDDFRRVVRSQMPDESPQVIDNVAWSAYKIAGN